MNTSPKFPGSDHVWIFSLLIFLAIIIHLPQLDFWPAIVQGDLGRDLYAFCRTQHGDLPYRGYFYQYGPLMPYYYAVFNILFGVNITSVLYGVILLDVLAGMLIYLILIRWTTPVTAILGASWFWLFYEKIIFNFNHIGAVPLILINVYLLIKFYESPRIWVFWGVVATVFILLLIKINIGLCIFASSFLIILAMIIKGRLRLFPIKWPLLWLFLAPLASAIFIYLLLFQGLPDYYIKQCLPITSGYHQFNQHILFVPKKLLWTIFYVHFFGFKPNYFPTSVFPIFISYWVVIVSVISFIFLFIFSKKVLGSWMILLITLLFLSHEFIIIGVPYELWLPYPLFICLLFIMAEICLNKYPWAKMIWLSIVGVTLVMQFTGVYYLKKQLVNMENHFIPWDKVKIYSWNPPNWILTVEETVNYLRTHLGPGEKFLALPYEPIYYWLLDRKSPVVETMFFDIINIPPQQEIRIIADLERERVKYIILSNRVHSPEAGLGKFGITNCPNIYKYINDNFKKVITFGRWNNSGEWFWDHAISIYERKVIDSNKSLSGSSI